MPQLLVAITTWICPLVGVVHYIFDSVPGNPPTWGLINWRINRKLDVGLAILDVRLSGAVSKNDGKEVWASENVDSHRCNATWTLLGGEPKWWHWYRLTQHKFQPTPNSSMKGDEGLLNAKFVGGRWLSRRRSILCWHCQPTIGFADVSSGPKSKGMHSDINWGKEDESEEGINNDCMTSV